MAKTMFGAMPSWTRVDTKAEPKNERPEANLSYEKAEVGHRNQDQTMNSSTPIQLSQYQPTWKRKFNVEKRKLWDIFSTAAIEIEHIGSTAIENLPSKPIIDIAVKIKNHKDADGFIKALAQIGYDFYPTRSSTERHFFAKGTPVKFHLSIAYTDRGGFWDRQILFRDFLRSNQEARDE
ncbi:MAG: GrpB family protein [Gemmatimonadetes bacterium]|nr:GrpB family protein [Gemmatimonadota bacterium]